MKKLFVFVIKIVGVSLSILGIYLSMTALSIGYNLGWRLLDIDLMVFVKQGVLLDYLASAFLIGFGLLSFVFKMMWGKTWLSFISALPLAALNLVTYLYWWQLLGFSTDVIKLVYLFVFTTLVNFVLTIIFLFWKPKTSEKNEEKLVV